MKLGRLILLPVLVPALMLAVDKEIIELQRDVALLQEQVRRLERALDAKLGSLGTTLQQSIDATTKSNETLAGLEGRMVEQQKNLVAPVVAMGSKLDQMTTEFSGLRDSVSDLTERMNKVQTQLLDVSNTVKTLQAPPPPPGLNPTSGPAGATTPPPGLSAKTLYDSAMRDRSGGNLDLATQGFEEYLKYFGNTELAPNAQFYLGQIAYDKNEFPNAIRAFDMVLERFPENSKTPDAMYMKGMALLRSGQRTQAGQEFLNLIEKFPNAEVTSKARQQRRALGMSVPAAPRKTTTRR